MRTGDVSVQNPNYGSCTSPAPVSVLKFVSVASDIIFTAKSLRHRHLHISPDSSNPSLYDPSRVTRLEEHRKVHSTGV